MTDMSNTLPPDDPNASPDVPGMDTKEESPPEPRLERKGGEPAPDISPEEFARLQQAGQLHIDPRGRVRTTRRESDAGVSLRRRRAWYAERRAL